MELASSNFGIVDYCVFGSMFIFSGAIGVYYSWKGNKSPEEFLMGNRALKTIPVAMSLITSCVSAISLLGLTGEIYGNGMQIAIFPIGACIAAILASHFFLPVLFPLKVTSVNEFIELRFKSKHLRSVISTIGLVKILLMMGVTLYAPTIALVSISNLSVLTYILLFGITCTAYSSFGGIRAVIWTDVFQLIVYLLGLILVVVIGCVRYGGLIDVLYVSSKGGRLDIFDMSLSPFVRHTFVNIVMSSVFTYLALFTSEQYVIQRMCAVKSIEGARSVLRYNILGIFLIYFFVFTGGLVAYATYVGCDPMALGVIGRKEQIMTHYVKDKMSFIPGLPGLFIASLIGATLSTLSSVINSCVATIWKDICLRYSFFKNASSMKAILTNKILSVIIGALITGLAILASKTHSIIEYFATVMVPLSGSVFGTFLIAYLFPKCNLKGVWAGLMISTIITVWMALGGLKFKEIPEMLPFSAENCDNRNSTLIIPIADRNMTLSTIVKEEMSYSKYGSFLMAFYNISYSWYGVIGPVLNVVVALIVSFATGNEKIEDVSPKYICHCVRKFYWKKEELERLLRDEEELQTFNIRTNENELPEREKMINNGQC